MLNYVLRWDLEETLRRILAWRSAQRDSVDACNLCEVDINADEAALRMAR